jgi:pimeloyl-ACP methyl ester carboxylesterase
MATHNREGWYHNDGLRLRYVEWGAADAPALIALHGLRSFAYTWEPVALPLASRFRIIALDHRGRGLSDWDPQRRYYAADYARDIQALVRHLGLRSVVLLGHSMGGANAFVYSSFADNRLAGMVIEDSGPGAAASSQGATRIRQELGATPAQFSNWADATAFWRSQRPNITEAALQARVQHSLKLADSGAIVWRHDDQGIAQARLNATPEQLVDLWPHVDAVSVPTLVLRGGISDYLSAHTASEMARRNPHIRWQEIAAASHYVHDENLPAFQSALGEFLGSEDLAGWARGSTA